MRICTLCLRILWMMLVMASFTASAQKSVHVVTKKVSESFRYLTGDTLVLITEKANIEIKTGTSSEISVNAYLISKNTDLDLAKEELNHLKFEAEKRDHLVSVSNYFYNSLGSQLKVTGNLQVRYEVLVPIKCPLVVVNRYGSLHAKGISGGLSCNLRFVDTSLSGISGNINITSFFSDILIGSSQGFLEGNIQKSDVRITNHRGHIKISAQYGEFTFDNKKEGDILLDANRSKVTFRAANLKDYNYNLKTKFSRISAQYFMGLDQKTSEYYKVFNPSYPMIEISTDYQPIELIQPQYTDAND